jgi:hypothetical protein
LTDRRGSLILRLVVSRLAILLLLPSTALASTERAPNQVSVRVPALEWADHDGTRHPFLDPSASDGTSFAAAGARLAYARSYSDYFELEPAVECLVPLGLEHWPGTPVELRFLLAFRGVLPLADGRLDLTLSVELGPTVSHLRDLTSLGAAVAGYAGTRFWITEAWGVSLEVGAGANIPLWGEQGGPGLPGDDTSSGYMQQEWNLLRLSVGVEVRF